MRAFCLSFIVLLLSACSIMEDESERGYSTRRWSTQSVFTTADVRLVTNRRHPVLNNDVLCTEPAPDIAKAVAGSLTGGASGGNGVATGSINVSGASSEAAAELAGRSTALLGLRDGLYRACEAYANGIIGQDVYALIVSHYGQLMTTLFLGQDVEGTAARSAGVIISSPALGAAPSTPAGQDKKPAAMTSVDAAPRLIPASFTSQSRNARPADLVQVKDAAPAPDGKMVTGSQETTSSETVSAAVSGVAARAITRMNEDYLHLGLLSTIIVSCINNSDFSRLRTPLGSISTAPILQDTMGDKGGNPWLTSLCKVLTPERLTEVLSRERTTSPNLVDPDIMATQAQVVGSHASGAVDHANSTIKAVQQALRHEDCSDCDPGIADGRDGARTRTAVRSYQRAHQLPVTGNPLDLAFLARPVHPIDLEL